MWALGGKCENAYFAGRRRRPRHAATFLRECFSVYKINIEEEDRTRMEEEEECFVQYIHINISGCVPQFHIKH
jgi:hypothetical protein